MKKPCACWLLVFVVSMLGCDSSDHAQPHNVTYIIPNRTSTNLEYVIGTSQYPSGETNLTALSIQADGHYFRDQALKDDKIYLLRNQLINVINAATLEIEVSKEVDYGNYFFNRIMVTDDKVYIIGFGLDDNAVLGRFDKTTLAEEGAVVLEGIHSVMDVISLGDKLVLGAGPYLFFIDAATSSLVETVELPEHQNVGYLLNGKDNDIVVVHSSKISIVSGDSHDVTTPDNIVSVAGRPAIDLTRNSIIYPVFAAQPSLYMYTGLYELNLGTMERQTLISDGTWFQMQINAVKYDSEHDVILLAGLGASDGKSTGRLRVVSRSGKSLADVDGFLNPQDVLISSH
jgi:hypothetical protein